MRRIATALVVFGVIASASTPAAIAAGGSGRPRYLAPPGNSAVSQYLEVVPSDAGGAVPRTTGKPSASLPSADARQLKHYGRAGRTLASVVADTGVSPSSRALDLAPSSVPNPNSESASKRTVGHRPRRASGSDRTRRHAPTTAAPTSSAQPPSGRGSAPVGAVLAAATGHEVGGGLGYLLPLVAAGGLVLTLVVSLRRWGPRRR